MRLGALLAGILVVALLAAPGCDIGGGSSKDAKPAPGVANDNVEVTLANYATLESALNASKGKVVVADFWATWCRPCRDRFPHLVALNEKHSKNGLACLSISIDDVSDQADVVAFLRRNGATFQNFLWADNTSKGRASRDQRFGMGKYIPHMAVFGRNGELVYSGSDKSPQEIEEIVEVELAKK